MIALGSRLPICRALPSPRVARPLSISSSAPTPPKPAADAASTQQAAASSETPPKAPSLVQILTRPSEVNSTTLFRMTNPEVNLDPDKRASWIVTGAVAVGCGLMLCYGFYQDSVTAAAKANAPHDPGAPPPGALKRLPDGRLLMKDGSIQKG